MQRVEQLGYVGFGVSDPLAWRDWATGILGLEDAGEADDELVRLRMDEYRNRLLVYRDSADDIGFIGWEVANRAALDDFAGQLSAAGVAVTALSAEEAAGRRVTGAVRFRDPSGIQCEIYHGAQVTFERPFQSPRPISGFVTGEQGIGHVVLAVDELQPALAFYRDVLGMRESDFITITRGGVSFEIAFLHCNPRHHTVALAEITAPKRLLHLMVQVASLDDVGATYSLCSEREVPIVATLGRHTNDHMVSFYMLSPAGFEIEYGWGARTIDDATWKVQTHSAPSIWGHQRG